MIKSKLKKNWILMSIMIIFTMLQQPTVNADEKNNNSMLKDIRINGHSIEPEFEMFTTEYVIVVEESIEKIEIQAIPDDKNAKVDITGDRNLKLGRNEFKIEVIAENGKNKQSYFLYVTKGDSKKANVNLKEIKIKDSGKLAPAFDKNIINYAFEYPESLDKLEIEAIAEASEAKVEIIGNENLNEEIQNIEIRVTAEDGQTVRTYYLIAKKGVVEIPEINDSLIEENKKEEQTKEKKSTNIICYIIIIAVIVIIVMTGKLLLERKKEKHEE